MPTKAPIQKRIDSALDITQIRDATKAAIMPVITRAASIVIVTATDYAIADAHLAKIIESRKMVKARFAPILDPLDVALKEIQSSRKSTQALVKELDDPLELSERGIREGMRQFKLEEMRQESKRQLEASQEQERLQTQVEEKRRLEESARTAPMRERLRLQREVLEAEAVEITATPVAVPVKVINSGTRIVKRWRCTNAKAILMKAISGGLPYEVLDTDKDDILIRFQHSTVANCPGVEMYDDVQIVRK